MNIKVTTVIVAGLLWIALPQMAESAETSVGISLGATYSDNIGRRPANEQSDTLAQVGLDLGWLEEEGKLTGEVNASLAFHQYMDDSYGDENYSTFMAVGSLELLPDTLDWVVEDHFGRVISDPFLADTPENRENVNTFATGPNMVFQFGSRTSVRLQSRFVSNSFETTDVDNTVKNGTISLVRATSPTRTVSFNVMAARVEFDSDLIDNDFDRQSVYLGVESRTAKGNLSLQLGVNEIHDRGDVREGLLSAIQWTRELSGSSSFTASFNQRYSEVGELFALYQGSGRYFNTSQDISAVAEPLENQRFELSYNYRKDDNDLYLSASWNDDDFEYSDGFDRQRNGIRGGISRTIASNWTAGLDLSYEKHDFESAVGGFDDVIAQFRISRRLTDKLSVNASIARFERDAEAGQTWGLEYSENRYSIFISYLPLR